MSQNQGQSVFVEPPTARSHGPELFTEPAWAEIGKVFHLSRRELDVAKAIFEDKTEYCTAFGLELSVKTVHTYTGRLYRKLGVTDRAQAVLAVFRALIGLVMSPQQIFVPICPHAHKCGVYRSTRCKSVR